MVKVKKRSRNELLITCKREGISGWRNVKCACACLGVVQDGTHVPWVCSSRSVGIAPEDKQNTMWYLHCNFFLKFFFLCFVNHTRYVYLPLHLWKPLWIKTKKSIPEMEKVLKKYTHDISMQFLLELCPFWYFEYWKYTVSALFSYLLLHIALKFCIWLCNTAIQIKFECRLSASIFEGVMPLLELIILESHSFSAFYSYMLWHMKLIFCIWFFYTVLQIQFECRQFASFLLNYAAFGTYNTGNTRFSALFSYILWHIELKWYILVFYFTVLQINFDFWHFRVNISHFWDHFVWGRITDQGSLTEMDIWSILFIKFDLKWFIHLRRNLSLYLFSETLC